MAIDRCCIICVLLMAGCVSSGIPKRDRLSVPDLGLYKTAYVLSYSDDWSDRRNQIDGFGDPYLNAKIFTSLAAIGIAAVVKDDIADLDIDCHYRTGLSLPYFNGNMDVFFSSLHTVNIKFIDRKTRKVICEMEYRRPRLSTMPPEDIVDQMFSKLLGREIISRDSSGIPCNSSCFGPNKQQPARILIKAGIGVRSPQATNEMTR